MPNRNLLSPHVFSLDLKKERKNKIQENDPSAIQCDIRRNGVNRVVRIQDAVEEGGNNGPGSY